jgi:hypothetical protein
VPLLLRLSLRLISVGGAALLTGYLWDLIRRSDFFVRQAVVGSDVVVIVYGTILVSAGVLFVAFRIDERRLWLDLLLCCTLGVLLVTYAALTLLGKFGPANLI